MLIKTSKDIVFYQTHKLLKYPRLYDSSAQTQFYYTPGFKILYSLRALVILVIYYVGEGFQVRVAFSSTQRQMRRPPFLIMQPLYLECLSFLICLQQLPKGT